jgi:hypothetical protein
MDPIDPPAGFDDFKTTLPVTKLPITEEKAIEYYLETFSKSSSEIMQQCVENRLIPPQFLQAKLIGARSPRKKRGKKGGKK